MGFFFSTTKSKKQIVDEATARYRESQRELHRQNIVNMVQQLENHHCLNVAIQLHNSLESFKMLESMESMRNGHKLCHSHSLKIKGGFTDIIKNDY